jgi:hypothetical protein
MGGERLISYKVFQAEYTIIQSWEEPRQVLWTLQMETEML